MMDFSFYFSILSENYILSLFVVLYMGFVFGSLINVLSSRMIIMENINNINIAKSIGVVNDKGINEYYNKYKEYNFFFPKSNCPRCSYKIKWWQNIPVLGFFLVRGKCYGCKEGISIEYPLIEIITTLMFFTLFHFFGLSYYFLIYSTLGYLLLIHLITDIKEKVLFDSITLLIFMILTSNLLITANHLADVKINLFVSFSIYLLFYVFIYMYEKLRGIEYSFGRGDIKLIAVLSVGLYIEQIMYFILLSAMLGLFLFLILYIVKKKQTEIPFAPSIIISFIIIFFSY